MSSQRLSLKVNWHEDRSQGRWTRRYELKIAEDGKEFSFRFITQALRNQKKVRKEPEWRRLPGQSCKVPNKLLMSLPTSDMDWFNFRVVGNVQAVKFSPCGMLLATGLDAERYHVLLIFEVGNFSLEIYETVMQ